MSASGKSGKSGAQARPVPGSAPFEPSPALKKELKHLLAELPNKRAASVPLLLHIQEECGQIDPDAQEWMAEVLDLPLIKVREVVTFYSMLKERPVGRQHIRVCRNLSCTLTGAEDLIEHMTRHLGCRPGERTPDGEISWELVECLGACEMGPTIQWDEEYIGNVDRKRFNELHRCRGNGGEEG